jgi:hypothetical protein
MLFFFFKTIHCISWSQNIKSLKGINLFTLWLTPLNILYEIWSYFNMFHTSLNLVTSWKALTWVCDYCYDPQLVKLTYFSYALFKTQLNQLVVSLCSKLTNRFDGDACDAIHWFQHFEYYFGSEGILYLFYPLRSALLFATRSSSWPQYFWSARWNWSQLRETFYLASSKYSTISTHWISHNSTHTAFSDSISQSLSLQPSFWLLWRLIQRFCSGFNHQQWHPTCELNLYSYSTNRPKRRPAVKI